MARTRNFMDGVVLNYGYQAVVMTIGLWLTPFLLHHLGQHDYGLWLVGLQSLTYLSLLDLGVIGLLPREVAKASGLVHTGSPPSILRRLIEDNAVVALWQTPLLAVALVVALSIYQKSHSGAAGPLILILATYGIQFPLRVFFAALEGLQDFAFLGYLQMAAWLAGVGVNVIMVASGMGLYGLALGWAVTQGTIALVSIWRIYARFGEFSPRRLRWLSFGEIRGYLRSGFWVSVSQVTQMLIKGTDVVLIASIQGAAAVVPYSCSSRLQSVLANQPQVILQSAQPGLTQLRTMADRNHLGRVIGALGQAMLTLSGAVGCVILAINEGFVRSWVGPGQYAGTLFTVLITIGMLFRHLNSTAVYTLFCFGKERYLSLIGLADSLCFAILMYVLVRRFGLIGAPLASIISVCISSLPWNIRMLAKVTGLSWRENIRPVTDWALPFSAVATVIALASCYLVPSGYLSCAGAAILVTAVYVGAEFGVIRNSLWWERARTLAVSSYLKLSARVRQLLFGFGAALMDQQDTR
jgi:O-antigen/teichoic acid export membrane protein